MLVGAWGHEVRCAYDGTSALALAAEFQPNVMLLDIAMPNMSGPELALQFQHQPRLNECFMIAVTGHTDALHRQQSEEAGIDLFLIKPVTPSILQTLLIWESEYVLRSRQEAATYNMLSTKLQPLAGTSLHTPTQLPCHVLQGAIAS
jgi:CheY-like chemotaxis protein